MHEVGLIGGTFDRFHAGHHSLLLSGLAECKHLEIWISSEPAARSKDSRLMDWESRVNSIRNNLGEDLIEHVSFHELNDEFGPAPTHQTASAIVCTSETRERCEEINLTRESNSLLPLTIIEVSHVPAHDGEPISSTRIRDGLIDTEGEPWIPESARNSTLLLTKSVESMLKDPFGILFEGPEENPQVAMRAALSEISENSPLIAVGDVTVRTLQDIGRLVDIALVDEMTKRERWDGFDEIDQSLYDLVLDCSNPAGSLTPGLLTSCETALDSWRNKGTSTLIRVSGEEDLAPLFLHPLAPLGAVIIYGQPGAGVVVREVILESKERCRRLLNLFDSE